MGLFGKKAVETGEAPAPRGYYRGPLPLPGRAPVSLSSYRGAALRASKIKHRDQARDKYVLARNRRAQVLTGTVMPQLPAPEALPALMPPPVYAQEFAPEFYSGAVVPYVEPAGYALPADPIVYPQYGAPAYGYADASAYGFADASAGFAAPYGYADASAGFFGGVPANVPSYSVLPTTGFVGY